MRRLSAQLSDLFFAEDVSDNQDDVSCYYYLAF